MDGRYVAGRDRTCRAELERAERLRARLGREGRPALLWEALQLVQSDPELAGAAEGGSPDALRAAEEALGEIRERLGATARDLRDLLPWASTEPMGPHEADAWVALLLATAEGRRLAEAWLDDIPEWLDLQEVGRRLGLENGRPEARHSWRNGNGAGAAELPDPGLLEDLRRVERLRRMLEPEGVRLEPWELLGLLVEDPAFARPLADRLLRAGAQAEAAGCEGDARRFFGRLWRRSAAEADLAREARRFLGRLRCAAARPELFDLAFAFLLASGRGRERARAWLTDPAGLREEAERTFGRGLLLAARYRAALLARLPERRIAAAAREV